MVVSRRSSAQLPSLAPDAPSKATPSASLRGNYHNKVPEIANQPLNTLLPLLKNGELHPEPYYITQNIVLKVSDVIPPWYEMLKSVERSLRDAWKGSSKFRESYIDNLVKDFIYESLSAIVSSTIMEEKSNHREEGRIKSWIELNLKTDINDIIKEICWEVLWDSARKLTRKESDALEDNYGRQKTDLNMRNVLRENYMKPLTAEVGQPLVHYRWALLVYHTNRYMQRGSLMENYAIVKLQEKIITQVAAGVLITETVKYRDQELKNMDMEERMENPPRKPEE